MAGLELFQRMSLQQVAKWLEVHPFEVVRLLALDGSLPADLTLDSRHVERVREAGGLEVWWDSLPSPVRGEVPARALVRAALARLLSTGCVEPTAVRWDNIFRGLDEDHQWMLRRSVTALVEAGVLVTAAAASGLTVSIAASRESDVRAFALEGSGVVDRLWDQA